MWHDLRNGILMRNVTCRMHDYAECYKSAPLLHDNQKWWQSLIEETWPESNPRILRDSKIWWLEVIHSNHFVGKGLQLNKYRIMILISTIPLAMKIQFWKEKGERIYFFELFRIIMPHRKFIPAFAPTGCLLVLQTLRGIIHLGNGPCANSNDLAWTQSRKFCFPSTS